MKFQHTIETERIPAIAGLMLACWRGRATRARARDWIRQFGTSRHDLARALAPDGAGGAMVAGETSGSLGGPNGGTLLISSPFRLACFCDSSRLMRGATSCTRE